MGTQQNLPCPSLGASLNNGCDASRVTVGRKQGSKTGICWVKHLDNAWIYSNKQLGYCFFEFDHAWINSRFFWLAREDRHDTSWISDIPFCESSKQQMGFLSTWQFIKIDPSGSSELIMHCLSPGSKWWGATQTGTVFRATRLSHAFVVGYPPGN